MEKSALRGVAAATAAVAATVMMVATATGTPAQASSVRPCTATKITVQFYYTKLRVFLDTELLWEKPNTNTNVTHTLPTVQVPAGSRFIFTGRRDTAPNPHALAVRVDWAPGAGDAAPDAPLLSSRDWEAARVSEDFASTLAAQFAPSKWERVVDVSNAVSVETKREAPAEALHVAASEPEKDPHTKFLVAFRSPPIPMEGACTPVAGGNGGSSLSSGKTVAISISSIAVVLAVIGGVVLVLRARRRRQMRAMNESEQEWPNKPASGVGGGDKLGDGGDGSAQGGPKADPVASSTSDKPPHAMGNTSQGGASGGGGGGGGDMLVASHGDAMAGACFGPLSVPTTGFPLAGMRSPDEDIRAQAVAAQALEADMVAAADALYQDTVASSMRGSVRGVGGAPSVATEVVDSNDGRSDSRDGGGGALSSPSGTWYSPVTATASSVDMVTIGSGSITTGSHASSAGLPAAASPPRVKRGVVLPDDDGLSAPPMPPGLWTPLPSPSV
ncbi:hypothetical protein MMPV_008125 [Pyropia vietnamensis]